MKEEFFWAVIALVWVFGWVTVWYLRRRALEARSLRLRELLHHERLAAIDKGVPLPEIPAEEEVTPAWLRPEVERVRAAWLRRLALILGLTALFTGIGMGVGFHLSPDRGFHVMWSLGFIPALGGIGLLLYAFLAGRGGSSD